MDRDFPPLPLAQSDLAKLTEMFPSVERPVVQMVLEGAEGGFEGAMEVLLGMVGPNLENIGQEMQMQRFPILWFNNTSPTAQYCCNPHCSITCNCIAW